MNMTASTPESPRCKPHQMTPCNLCGLPCNLEPPPWDMPLGLVNAMVVGGYPSTPGNGSGALDDFVGYKFSLCEFCLDHLFAQFKIPVETFDPKAPLTCQPGENIEATLERTGGVAFLVQGPEPEAWKPAEERVLSDSWRTDKEGFFARKDARDAARRKT